MWGVVCRDVSNLNVDPTLDNEINVIAMFSDNVDSTFIRTLV